MKSKVIGIVTEILIEIIGDIIEIKTQVILTIEINGIEITHIQIIPLQIIRIIIILQTIIPKIIQRGRIEEDLTEIITVIITIVVEIIDLTTIIDTNT